MFTTVNKIMCDNEKYKENVFTSAHKNWLKNIMPFKFKHCRRYLTNLDLLWMDELLLK